MACLSLPQILQNKIVNEGWTPQIYCQMTRKFWALTKLVSLLLCFLFDRTVHEVNIRSTARQVTRHEIKSDLQSLADISSQQVNHPGSWMGFHPYARVSGDIPGLKYISWNISLSPPAEIVLFGEQLVFTPIFHRLACMVLPSTTSCGSGIRRHD